ncbi:unnamed protein product, partial [Ectocarpus sp. 12 AP-2014]
PLIAAGIAVTARTARTARRRAGVGVVAVRAVVAVLLVSRGNRALSRGSLHGRDVHEKEGLLPHEVRPFHAVATVPLHPRDYGGRPLLDCGDARQNDVPLPVLLGAHGLRRGRRVSRDHCVVVARAVVPPAPPTPRARIKESHSRRLHLRRCALAVESNVARVRVVLVVAPKPRREPVPPVADPRVLLPSFLG